MKKLFIITAIITLLAGCKDDVKEFKIDPLSTVKLRPATSIYLSKQMAKTNSVLSALEIVKQTTVIHMTMNNGLVGERAFDKLQRDTSESDPKLMMWATDIINSDMQYVPDFIESTDVILVHWRNPMDRLGEKDTIAYIPNSVIKSAQIAIKSAYDNKDAETCIKIFNEAFKFIPITGEGFRQLKKEGLN